MTNADAMAAAILEIERILAEYLEPGHAQDPTTALMDILAVMDKHDAVGAAHRAREGYTGPKLVR